MTPAWIVIITLIAEISSIYRYPSHKNTLLFKTSVHRPDKITPPSRQQLSQTPPYPFASLSSGHRLGRKENQNHRKFFGHKNHGGKLGVTNYHGYSHPGIQAPGYGGYPATPFHGHVQGYKRDSGHDNDYGKSALISTFKKGHHDGFGHKSKKGYHDKSGYKKDNHGNHGKWKHSSNLDKHGTKYSGNQHRNEYLGDGQSGYRGKKGHHFGSKGYRDRGHRDKGFKNVYHKEEFHHSKKFYDDGDSKKYFNKYDDFDSYFKGQGVDDYKGTQYEGDFDKEKYESKDESEDGGYHSNAHKLFDDFWDQSYYKDDQRYARNKGFKADVKEDYKGPEGLSQSPSNHEELVGGEREGSHPELMYSKSYEKYYSKSIPKKTSKTKHREKSVQYEPSTSSSKSNLRSNKNKYTRRQTIKDYSLSPLFISNYDNSSISESFGKKIPRLISQNPKSTELVRSQKANPPSSKAHKAELPLKKLSSNKQSVNSSENMNEHQKTFKPFRSVEKYLETSSMKPGEKSLSVFITKLTTPTTARDSNFIPTGQIYKHKEESFNAYPNSKNDSMEIEQQILSNKNSTINHEQAPSPKMKSRPILNLNIASRLFNYRPLHKTLETQRHQSLRYRLTGPKTSKPISFSKSHSHAQKFNQQHTAHSFESKVFGMKSPVNLSPEVKYIANSFILQSRTNDSDPTKKLNSRNHSYDSYSFKTKHHDKPQPPREQLFVESQIQLNVDPFVLTPSPEVLSSTIPVAMPQLLSSPFLVPASNLTNDKFNKA